MARETPTPEPTTGDERLADEVLSLLKSFGADTIVLSFRLKGAVPGEDCCSSSSGESIDVLQMIASMEARLLPHHLAQLTPADTLKHGFILAPRRGQG